MSGLESNESEMPNGGAAADFSLAENPSGQPDSGGAAGGDVSATAASRSPPRCPSPPAPAASAEAYAPDSPISRFRRDNDLSPAGSDDDEDDEKKSDAEFASALDARLAEEIRAARRRASSWCGDGVVSDVAPVDGRVQELVHRALGSPRGVAYERAVTGETRRGPLHHELDPGLGREQRISEEGRLVGRHDIISNYRSAPISALYTQMQALSATSDDSGTSKVRRFVHEHGFNESDFKFSSLLDEEAVGPQELKGDHNQPFESPTASLTEASGNGTTTENETDAFVHAGRIRLGGAKKSENSTVQNQTHDRIAVERLARIPDVDDVVRRTRSPEISDLEDEEQVRKTAHFAANVPLRSAGYPRIERSCSNGTELSITESEVGSLDGLPLNLQQRWLQSDSRREKIMQNLDGFPRSLSNRHVNAQIRSSGSHLSNEKVQKKCEEGSSLFGSWFSNIFGETKDVPKEEEEKDKEKDKRTLNQWNDDDTFAILGCANMINTQREGSHFPPVIPSSLVRVAACHPPPPTYSQSIFKTNVDQRMQSWIQNHFSVRDRPSKDGKYHLGSSRTVIVHEIARGNWTWCTDWSPDGSLLAVATENHHLAIVDTTNSAVWRVRHDRRITAPAKNGTTHSIRSIAWGRDCIAIGGTGNAVSILAPREPYAILHTILDTGFVGSLSWKPGSSDLAIASRAGKATVVRIRAPANAEERTCECRVMHEIQRDGWVNSVAFSPGGQCLAIGDGGGNLLVYDYPNEHETTLEMTLIKSFLLDDSVITVEWSADGRWLYAGGEDFKVTVVETRYWEIVHRVKRDRWVQCIASSHSGTHIAVGGVASEISLLDVENGWDSVMGIELNGLVPLSASWHPSDQYLALTGQSNSILVVETTNARHVRGHHLHSISKILATEFSPDGRTAIVGNAHGVITFFALTGKTFETVYELVVLMNDRLSIQWSLNGVYVVIASQGGMVIVGKTPKDRRAVRTTGLPPESSGFSVRKVIRDLTNLNAVAIDFESRYIAVSGNGTWILDVTANFTIVREWSSGAIYANAWSPDGRWLATIGQDKVLTIYDTSDSSIGRWRTVFSVPCDDVGRALAWCPLMVGGLLYLAYGGDAKKVTIMEIRCNEGTWETVLRIPRAASINALDWSPDGLLAAAIGNGTVSVIDLAYLQLGMPVNEMDYAWQRQALTCFTEIRRNRGKNSMSTVRWIPSAPGSDSLLAVGGTDGEVEIVDLTERSRCRGYMQASD